MGVFSMLKSFTNTSTYRSNLFENDLSQQQPDKWYKGDTPTVNETLGRIYSMKTTDPVGYQNAAAKLSVAQSDPSSMFYSPYIKPTNKSINALAQLGYNVDNIDDDWYDRNAYLMNYYETNSTTNNVKAPTKNTTKESQAAYYYNQVLDARETTKKAQLEAKALDEEIGFWTNWSERNYSDEQVRGKVRTDFAKKYPTLQKMLDSAKSGEPINLNSAVPYATDDWIDGRTWAYRNDGGYEKDYKNQAMAGLGQGNLWQEDQEITDRLNPKNEKYAPYTVSSTLDDACAYYGVNGFQKGWLEANKPDGTDPVENSMYNKVFEAEKFTQQAEGELDKFNAWLSKILVDEKDPEKVMDKVKKRIDNGFYPALKDMSDSLNQSPDKIKGTTRAIDFSPYDIRQQVEQTCARNSGKLTGDETIAANGGTPLTQQTAETIKTTDGKIRGALDLFEEDMTDMELSMFRNAGSSAFNSVMKGLKSIPTVALMENNVGKVSNRFITDMVPLYKTAQQYDEAKEQFDTLIMKNQVALKTDPVYSKLEKIRTADSEKMAEDEKAEVDQVNNWFSIYRDPQATKLQRESAMANLYQYFSGENLDEVYIEAGEMNQAVRDWSRYLEDANNTPWALGENAANYRDRYERTMADTEWARSQIDGQEAILDAKIKMYEDAGVNTTELKTAKAVAKYLTGFTEKQATVWSSFNYYEQMMTGENEGVPYAEVKKEAAQGNEQVKKELDNLKWVKNYISSNGIQLPDNVIESMAKKESFLNGMQEDYKYFALRGNDDFKEMAEKGRELEAKEKTPLPEGWAVTSNWMTYDDSELADWGLDNLGGADMMTPVERDTWYYLYAKEGKQAAIDYYKRLHDKSFPMRIRENADAAARAEVNSGVLGAIWANTKAVISAPIEALGSLVYVISSAVSDEELSPGSSNVISNAVQSETVKSIQKSLGEDTLAGKLATGLYEMLYNRARSTANAFTFGGLGEMFSGKFSGMLNEFAGAAPMALTAATDAISTAKLNGADDSQAWLMGLITFIGEDISEGLTYGNIKEAFKGGEDAVISSVKDAVVNWLTKSGVEEAIGEVSNDIWSNVMGEMIMGEKSDRNRQIDELTKELMEQNPNMLMEDARKQAEDTVYREEYLGYLHTAIISYLSPGLDVPVQMVSQLFNKMQNKGQKQDQQGQNITDIEQARMNYDSLMRAREAMGSTVETTMEEAQQLVSPNPILSDADKELIDALSRLDAVADSDVSTQTAAIVDLFGEEENTPGMDMAKAAAVNMAEVFGGQENAVKAVSDLVMQARIARVRVDLVLEAVKTAALSPSSEARKAVGLSADATTSDGVSLAPADKVIVLAGTVSADAVNEVVQAEIAKATTESRVAEAEKDIIASNPGAVDTVTSFSQIFDKAEKALQEARDAVKARRDERQAKSEALIAAAQAFADNPTTENKNAQTKAMNELDKALTVEKEYEQHLEKAQADYDVAWDKLQAARGTALTDVRQQAEQAVAEQNAQREEAANQKAAAEQAAAQEAARLKAEEEERTGKAAEDRRNAIIEQILDKDQLEGEEREKRREELTQRADTVKIKLKDLRQPVGKTDGMLAIYNLGRKLGTPITFEDLGPATGDKVVRGKFVSDENGARIVLNKNLLKKMSAGQAIVEAAWHEFSHRMEDTKLYQAYRGVVLESVFGAKNAGDAVDLYNTNEAFRAKVDAMMIERAGAGDKNFLGDDINAKIQAAEHEIVADFARLNLAEQDVVDRFLAVGLGGKIKNTLHNINQAVKNYFGGLRGEERQTAEYLRRAERAFQKALDNAAKTQVHPGKEQLSITQVAQAAGMRFDPEKLTLYDKNGNVVDGVLHKITSDDMRETPVGYLIRNGLNMMDGQNTVTAKADPNYVDPTSTAGKALDMMTGLVNMIARYKDSDLVWEIGASTLSSTFSAMKSNSDTQYQTTIDFGTICAKTQAIIDVMSKVMIDKIDPKTGMLKKGMKAGLTRTEIMEVYDATHNAKLSVPCPVCYVFSRWMGVPSLLGQMSQFQKDHVVTKKDKNNNVMLDKDGRVVIDWKETQKHVDKYVKDMLDKYKSKDGIDNRKTKLQNKMTSLETKRNDLEKSLLAKGLSDKQKEDIKSQIKDILAEQVDVEDELGKVRAFNWVSQALCVNDGKFKVDDKNFRITPDSVLFDLNQTARFAEDTKNWTFRNTRGAGMGKAILPASGESLGDILYGVNKANGGKRQSAAKNPWFNYDKGGSTSALRQLQNAINRSMKQNLLGGQRMQSTSDFRPEWGLDYIMSFLELQAAKSKVQLYTKVGEAVDFLTSVGAEVNMSIMGKGTGWREATKEEIAKMTKEQLEEASLNGKVYVLEFSDITGMPFYSDPATGRKGAVDYKNEHDNAQLILVGMNDTHIRLAMKNSDIDFIIPWHSSGNSKDVLASLISAVGEKLNTSVDYTKTQSDMKKGEKKSYYDENGNKVEYAAPGQQTDEEKQLWDLRMRILTGRANKDVKKGGFTEAERNLVYHDPWLSKLYERFYVKGVDDACYGVALSSKQAGQVFPYEYWQTDPTKPGGRKETADENGRRFVEYVERMGIIPRFSQFKNDPGYWKLLIDRPMYNRDGTYHEQQVINVTNARVGQLDENGKLDRSTTDLPTQARAVYAPKDQRNPMYEAYKAMENNAIMAAEKRLGIPRTDAEAEAIDTARALQEVPYADGADEQLSVYGEQTEADEETLRETNEDYLNAIARKDVRGAEQDVSFYAEKKGYTQIGYHGTDFRHGFGFSKFDMGESQNSIFVAHDSTLAGTYTATGAYVRPLSEKGKDIHELSDEDLYVFAFTRLRTITDDNGNKVKATVSYGDKAGEFILKTNDGKFGSSWVKKAISRNELIKYLNPIYEKVSKEGIYKLYLKPGKQLVIDAEDHNWNDIPFDLYGTKATGNALLDDESFEYTDTDWDEDFDPEEPHDDHATTREIARWARAHGYDSVRINNIYDDGGRSSRRADGMDGYGDISIYFNPEDVKSADPVTYDDEGNVIPLNQRFDDENADIRYSSGGETTEADEDNALGGELANVDQELIDAGILTPEEIATADNLPSGPVEEGGSAQRQFGHQTAQGSDALHQDVKDYLYSHSSYTPDSNQEQIDRAISWVQSKATADDPDGFYAALNEVESPDFDYRSADGQARMLTVMGMAALRDDRSAELRLADAFNKQGTDLGRQLQARKLFRLMTPVGRKAALQSMAKQVNDEFAKEGNNTRLVIPELLLEAAGMAETEGDFQKVQEETARVLAEQIPANWKEKLTGWRMLAMLGNPRTHIRNILGNFMFMPMVGIKNKIGAVAELGMKTGNKTKTIGFATSDARAFARQDAQMIKDVLTGDAKYNDGDLVQQNRKTWGTGKSLISKTLGKALQAVSDFNGRALEAEDWIFLNRHYRNALAGYMTANKLTSADMTGETLEKARTYAVQEAQKATYRDFNKLASTLSEVGRKGGGFGFLVNAALPFKKTPANILKRGIEYSPVGIMKALTVDAYHLKQYIDYQNGKLIAMPEKAISPNQWIDKIASGLTGTAVLALGGLLSSIGAIRSGFDDDDPDDQYDKERGAQEYALEFEILGQDVSMTIDWAAPMSMPLFVGASVYDTISKLNKGEDIDTKKLAEAFVSITEPVFNLSMLDGVNSLLDVKNYSGGNAVTQIFEKLISNYASSYVPTLSGQIARTIDTVRRKSYVKSGEAFQNELYEWEKIENKVPFLSQSNIPYRNVWGETSEKETLAAGLENFLSPAYWSEIKDDALIDELQRLNNSDIPDDKKSALKLKMPGKTVSDKRLDAEEYDKLTVERGQTAKRLLTELMASPEYGVADDITKAEMISDVWTYSNQRANNIVAGTDMDSWVSASLDGDPVKAVINRAITRNMNAQKTGYKKALENALVSGKLEDAQTAIAGLRRSGKSDSSIKTDVTNTLKPLYQNAFLNADFNAMNEIEDILDNLDEDIVWRYVDWVTKLNQEEEPEGEKEEESVNINWLNRNYR